MVKLAVAVAAAALAVAVSPSPPAAEASPEAMVAWPEPVVRVVDLGRRFAAVDVAWLRTVQMIGDDDAARAHYPHLEDWIDLETRLDEKFAVAYAFGAILLTTDAARADKVDEMLARGERAMPEDFTLSQYRGFLAYFGRLDPIAAAEHYEKAAQKGGPRWYAQFAARLRKQGVECEAVLANLQEVYNESNESNESKSSYQAEAMKSERAHIFEACWKKTIELAATKFRMQKSANATDVKQLVDGGYLGQVWQPHGMCWQLSHERATLAPCPTNGGGP